IGITQKSSTLLSAPVLLPPPQKVVAVLHTSKGTRLATHVFSLTSPLSTA
ncbi:hypothetical protein BaRGS_00032819, partial [Batillaria attramentaria]